MKVNIHKIITVLLLLCPITTLVQGVPQLAYVNKLLFGLVILFLAYANITFIRKKDVYIYAFTLLVWVNSLININPKFFHINEVFYLWVWVLFFNYLDKYSSYYIENLYQQKKLIRIIFIVWSFLVLTSVKYKNAYISEWGETGYFKSYADNAFRFAVTCLVITILIGLYVKITNKKKYLLFLLIPVAGVAATGSRTYLLLVLLVVLPIYYRNVSKKIFIVTSLPIIGLLMYIVFNSNIVDKFEYVKKAGALNNKSFLSTMTSGRIDFWKIDLDAYLTSGFIGIILGHSITFSYEINSLLYSLTIQAHNDFLNMLLSYGIIGLLVYIKVFIDFYKKTKNDILNVNKKYLMIFWMVYLGNAIINGVIEYLGATIALSYILIVYSNENRGTIQKEG